MGEKYLLQFLAHIECLVNGSYLLIRKVMVEEETGTLALFFNLSRKTKITNFKYLDYHIIILLQSNSSKISQLAFCERINLIN